MSQTSQLRRKARNRMSAGSRVVAYLPSLQTILQRLRATSTTPSSLGSALFLSGLSEPQLTTALASITQPTSKDPSQYSISTLQSQLHPQFPLPGGVSLPSLTTPTEAKPEPEQEAVTSFLTFIREKPQGTVELLIQECPLSLVRGFVKLFPGLQAEGLTVITLCERTRSDMTSWSAEVEEERESLLEHFVNSAKEICARLTGAGSFADFIDPSSGRAFYSPFSHNALFETDDRFRYLGFEIEDLGCCKCLQHPVWGPYVFVGTIFTDAATSSPILKTISEL